MAKSSNFFIIAPACNFLENHVIDSLIHIQKHTKLTTIFGKQGKAVESGSPFVV